MVAVTKVMRWRVVVRSRLSSKTLLGGLMVAWLSESSPIKVMRWKWYKVSVIIEDTLGRSHGELVGGGWKYGLCTGGSRNTLGRRTTSGGLVGAVIGGSVYQYRASTYLYKVREIKRGPMLAKHLYF
jgi:hypothetical protein